MIKPLPFRGAIPDPGSNRKIVHTLPGTERYVARPEMEHLRRFWRDQPRGGVLLLVGLGGSGKTCLVDHFLDEVPGARSLRVAGIGTLPATDRLLVWSFYQSANCDAAANAYDHLCRNAGPRERTLVVLDGLEAVQKPRGTLGEIAESCTGLRGLLRDCATSPESRWIIVTSRHSLPDVSGPAMKEISVNGVDPKSAREILRKHEVKGEDAELDALVARTVPHSKWLALVGTALREWHNGTIPNHLPWLGDFEGGPQVERLANQLTRLLAWYEDKLKEDEIAVLKLIALLSKPVSAAEIQPLLKPAMGTESSPLRLHGILGRLVALFLIDRRSRVSGEWEYTAHPLVLQHFQTAWIEDRLEEIKEEEAGAEEGLAGPERERKFFVYEDADSGFNHGFPSSLFPPLSTPPKTVSNVIFKVAYAVAFAPDGQLLAIASPDRKVTLSHTRTGRVFHILEGHTGSVRAVAFSPNNALLVTGSRDRTVKLWDVATGRLLHTLKGHRDRVTCVAFSRDGGMVASGSSDTTVRLWDAGTGALLRTLVGDSGYVLSLSFSEDESMLATGSSDGTVKLWDARTAERLTTLEGHDGWVTSVACSSYGSLLASASEDKTVRLWRKVEGGRLLGNQEFGILEGHSGIVNSVAFSRDQTLASVSDDGSVRLWDAQTSRVLRTLEGLGAKAVAVACALDRELIAVAVAPTSLVDALRRIQLRTRGAVRTRGQIRLR